MKQPSQTPYLDLIGFSEWLVGKLPPEKLAELDGYVKKADALIDKLGVLHFKKSNPFTHALERWTGEGVGGDGIYTYADMFGSYRDLYNLLEKAAREDPKYKPGQELLLYAKQIYEILPLPSMKETFEDRVALKKEMHKSLRKS